MMKTRLAIAALVSMGLAGAPFAAEAKKYKHLRHYVSTMQSGTSVGTVTAPSVGSYNWPSVGVTNAVPTWKNTNPK